MNDFNFNAMIDYAVRREREGVRFYKELRSNGHFEHLTDFLRKLQLAEERHIEILERIRVRGTESGEYPDVLDLQIGESSEEPEGLEGMGYSEILLMGMKRKSSAYSFYNELTRVSGDREIRDMFETLAEDETAHKAFFENLYDQEI